MLISELQFAQVGNVRLFENPIRYSRLPVDLSRCDQFEEPAPADLVAAAKALSPVKIVVDGGARVGKFNRLWEGSMDIVPRMTELGTKHVRLWGAGLFAGIYPAEGVYSWEHLDRVMQGVTSLGAKPFVTMTTVPQWLWQRGVSEETVQAPGVPARRIGDITPPRDLRKWANLVRDTVAHLNVHKDFGVEYLEVWNEPTARVFWNGTLEEYLELYEATAIAAKQADPSIKVGGPATAGLQPEWIRPLMRRCKEREVPLDFISWHCFSRDPARYDRQVRYVRGLAAELDLQPELCITQWNYAWGVREMQRLSSPFAASYALASIKAMEDARLDVAIYFASADWTGLGTYSGLVLSDGKTPKPVYNAFKMLASLGEERIEATSPGEKVGLDVLAARKDGELAAVVWWWVGGTGQEQATAAVDLAFTGLDQNARYRWEMYAIDNATSNFGAGKGKQELTLAASGEVPEQSRRLSLDLTLPLYGVQMVRVIPL
jgi:xylan 1,4-beta-xylosidase